VSEAAILLQELLPIGAPLPGGLRYAIARALHEVDVPPFDSLGDFSNALARFERGDRRAAVRRLWRRAEAVHALPSREGGRPDRRAWRDVATVRRHLRESDRRLYEDLVARQKRPGRTTRFAFGVAAGAALVTTAWFAQTALWPATPAAPQSFGSTVRHDIVLRAPAAATAEQKRSVKSARPRRTTVGSRPGPRPRHVWRVWPGIRIVDDFGRRIYF
jgi:hypothetical protein